MKRLLTIAAVLVIATSTSAQMRCWIVGDVNNDGLLNMSDAVSLSNFLYAGGPAPERSRQADFDESGTVTGSDLVLLLRYLYCGCDSCLGPLDTFCEFHPP